MNKNQRTTADPDSIPTFNHVLFCIKMRVKKMEIIIPKRGASKINKSVFPTLLLSIISPRGIIPLLKKAKAIAAPAKPPISV